MLNRFTYSRLLAGVLIAGASTFVVAQGDGALLAGSNEPTLHRELSVECDAPSKRLLLRIPAHDGTLDGSDDGAPSAEHASPPSEPSFPPVEKNDPPTFFGEAVSGKVIFVLDVSLSMTISDVGGGEDYDGNVVGNMSRLDAVKYETVKALKNMSEGDFFDFVLLAGAEPTVLSGAFGGGTLAGGGQKSEPITDAWKGELVEGTPEVIEDAIEFVQGLTTWYGTPTYVALKRACEDYGHDLSKFIFLSDGAPFPKDAYGSGPDGHKSVILEEFPGWYAPILAKGCDLAVIHIGQNKNAGTFMQDFAAATGADYTHK